MASQTTRILGTLWITGIIAASSPAIAADQTPDNPEDASSGYELGQGLRLGDSGFTLGGYAAAAYQQTKDANARSSLRHMSLFLWWEGSSRLKFFSELDSEDTLATRYRSDAGERRYLTLERFYFDYAFNDTMTLRAGKFLTPIGRWNLIHADPLVWTTSRPLITSSLYPENATGLMALGSTLVFQHQFDYTFYTSVGEDPHKDPAQDPFSEAYGTHANFSITENSQVGLSYTTFAQTAIQEEHKQLFGADYLWARNGYELTGEAAYVKSNQGTQRTAKGAFVQGVMPLYSRLYGVGRVEFLRLPQTDQSIRRWVLGLTYRTSHSTAFKIEYLWGFHDDYAAPEGILSSVSVLF
jgi:hypothetical protein